MNWLLWNLPTFLMTVKANVDVNSRSRELIDHQAGETIAAKNPKVAKAKGEKSPKSKPNSSSKSPSKSPSELSSKSSKPSKDDPQDEDDEDGPQDNIIYIARCLKDPLGALSPEICGSSADFNGDDIIDLQDLEDVIAYSFTIYTPEDLKPLWPTMIQEAMAYWPLYQSDSTESVESPNNEQFPAGINEMSTDPECADPGASWLPWMPLPDRCNRRLLLQDKNSATDNHGVPAWANEHRQLQPMCGLGISGRFGKGNKDQDPPRKWTNDYPYDPNFELNLFETAGSFIWYTTYFYGIPIFFGGRGWFEAAAAWIHYTTGLGSARETDYEVAYNKDSNIKTSVDREIEDVKRAVKALHGDEASFEFYSTGTRSVRSDAAGEYQAVLGGHLIWSSGTVTYNSDACSLQVDITIKAEDFYDFNVWDGTSGDQFVNLIPGAFASLGWAMPYITTGKITRTETIDLDCCKDEDCGDPTEFECECNLCTTQCPTEQRAGGYGRFQQFTVDLLKTQGTFQVYYDMYTIADQLKIYYGGVAVFSTGGLVSGSNTVFVSYGGATSTATTVTIEVDAPDPDTAWEVAVSCPP